MSVQADQQAQALQQRLATDPAFKAKVAGLAKIVAGFHSQIGKTHSFTPDQAAQFKQAAVQLSQLTGMTGGKNLNQVGAPEGWMFDASGNLTRDHGLRNDIITVGSIVGGGALAGAAGAAAAGGGAAGGAAGGGAAGGGSAAATGGSLAAGGGSAFTKALIGAGINSGVGVLNSYLQSRAVNKAAGQETAAITKAQGVLDKTNQQNQANLSPFLGLGSQAANALGSLTLGSHYTPVSAQNFQATAPVQGSGDTTTPAPVAGSSLTDYAAPNAGDINAADRRSAPPPDPNLQAQSQRQSSYVRMRAPDGSEKDVPDFEVPHWLEQGAQQIGAVA